MRSTPSRPAFDHPPPFYFGGVGAPPPLPLGMSGGYGAPFSLSGMHYDYGPRGGAPGPYGLLTAYGPPGPMGGSLYLSLSLSTELDCWFHLLACYDSHGLF